MAKAAAKAAKTFTVEFDYLNDTPGTHRFQEVGNKDDYKIGGLYIKKGNIDPECKHLSVTITQK